MKPERKREGAARRGRLRAERVFDGLGVSPGVAIGAAHVVEAGFIDVPEYTIAEDAVAAEQQRFADALAKSQRQLKKLKDKPGKYRAIAKKVSLGDPVTDVCKKATSPVRKHSH